MAGNALRATALDQAMYQVPAIHDGQIRCLISFRDRLDAARLARAVSLSLYAAPVLGCRYQVRPWRSRWQRCPAESLEPFSQVLTADPASAIDSFLSGAMDPLHGPQLAVRLVRADADTLCVKLHHLVADGGGLLEYIRLLRDLYDRLRLEPDYVPPACDAGARGLWPVLHGAGWRAVLHGLSSFRLVKAEWGFPRTSSDLSGCAFPERRIEPVRLAELKAWCRARQCRLSDVLLTAYHRALTATVRPAAEALLPIEVTIDLRRHLPRGSPHTVSDLSGASFPAVRHTIGSDFGQTLSEVQAASAATRDTPLGGAFTLQLLTLLPTFLQSLIARLLLRRYFTGMVSPVLSNLGPLDTSVFEFSGAQLRGVDLFGPVMFPPHFLLSSYSFRGQLRINSSICSTAVNIALVNALLDRFIDELPV